MSDAVDGGAIDRVFDIVNDDVAPTPSALSISDASVKEGNSGTASLVFAGVLEAGQVPNGVGCKVKSFTTFDVAARYEVNKRLSLHGSIRNLFNASAPLDWATYGGALGAVPWNPSLHSAGAIGRYFTVGLTYQF